MGIELLRGEKREVVVSFDDDRRRIVIHEGDRETVLRFAGEYDAAKRLVRLAALAIYRAA